MLHASCIPVFCASFLWCIGCISLESRIGIISLFLLACYLVVIWSQIHLGVSVLIGVIFAMTVFSFSYQQYLEQSDLDGEQIELQAYVMQKELRSNNRQRITFVSNKKKYQATLFRYPQIEKGDWIQIDCLLKQPDAFSGFHYPRYLFSQGIEALCESGGAQVISREEPLTLFESGRISLAQRIKQKWPRPISSLVAGLLLGTRESFSQRVLESFSRSGVTHIIALSGFNISILIVFIEQILITLFVPRKLRAITVVVSIFLFTFFVGAGASIMRAAIMGSLAYCLQYFGRTADIWRSMLLTATLMTILNPFVLMYDIGFQLSFVSTLGLVYLTPIVTKLFSWLPEAFSLKESFVTTIAATIGTLPLILLKFGVLSVVSPFANVLILPVIPWLMLTGFLGVFIQPIFVDLTTLGARYVLLISDLFSQPDWASQVVEITSVQFFVFIMLIFLLIYGYSYYEKNSAH